ncbi:hypothetical protein ACM91E_28580, partial [Escherichia coli]|uniref:hypothetical protein n=1 Tax=Escherichia coli TaxID=562 RepID=UPI003B9A0FAE
MRHQESACMLSSSPSTATTIFLAVAVAVAIFCDDAQVDLSFWITHPQVLRDPFLFWLLLPFVVKSGPGDMLI